MLTPHEITEPLHCPQCGEDTPQLFEGYCEACCKANQVRLDDHNSRFDRWENMTDRQRQEEIEHAVRKAIP